MITRPLRRRVSHCRQSWPSRDAALEHFRHKKAFAGWQPKVLDDYIDHGTVDDERGQHADLAGHESTSSDETVLYFYFPWITQVLSACEAV